MSGKENRIYRLRAFILTCRGYQSSMANPTPASSNVVLPWLRVNQVYEAVWDLMADNDSLEAPPPQPHGPIGLQEASSGWDAVRRNHTAARNALGDLIDWANRMIRKQKQTTDGSVLDQPVRKKSKGRTIKPSRTPQDERNQWLYDQCFDMNQTLDQIAARMPHESGWRRLSGKQAVRDAVRRHVAKFELNPPPRRQDK